MLDELEKPELSFVSLCWLKEPIVFSTKSGEGGKRERMMTPQMHCLASGILFPSTSLTDDSSRAVGQRKRRTKREKTDTLECLDRTHSDLIALVRRNSDSPPPFFEEGSLAES